jgi:hypothetical protein
MLEESTGLEQGSRERVMPRPLATPDYRLSALRWWVLVFLTTVFTLAVVQYSEQYGRLMFAVPTYEDSRYVTDGMRRLQEFYDRGFVAAVRSYFADPPASLFSSGLAAAGYALFGLRDWAPYAMNGLLVLCLLLYLDRRLYGIAIWQAGLIFFFVLLTPLPFLLVHEYRPDLACGMFTAIGILTLVEAPLDEFTGSQMRVAGVAWGLALYVKPSVFPGTLIFLGGALGISAMRIRVGGRNRSQWRRFAHHGAAILGLAALISLPYFAAGLKYQLGYLLSAIFSPERQYWVMQGGLRDHLLYYLTGPAGDQIFFAFRPVFAAVLLAGVCWAAFRGERRLLVEIGFAAAALLLGFLVPTALPNKAYFGNATFAWLILFYAAFTLAVILTGRQRRGGFRVAGALLVSVLLAGACVQFRWNKWGNAGSPYVQRSNEIMREIAHLLVEEARAGKTKVFLTTIGMHTDLGMEYLAMKEHFDPRRMNIVQIPFADSLDLYLAEIRKADIVLATEEGADMLPYPLPCARYQNQVLERLRQDPEFYVSRRLVAASGKSYYVFERGRAPDRD